MATKSEPSGVRIQRKELRQMQEKYQKISDTLAGEESVKKAGKKYLPVPSSCEKGEYDPRYEAYQTRALFYNVCEPTRNALVGQLFLRPPVLELPTGLDFLIEDMNGEGLNLEQLTRKAANYVLADFSRTMGEVTKADIDSGRARPIVRFFEPWAIRNWDHKKIGNVKKLTMLVLDEMREVPNPGDEFDIETKLWHRVYRLIDSRCSVQVYDEDGKSQESYEILGSDGMPLDYIPFEFIGSENNDSDVDEPPFLNLANLNLAHFRNSADYEESVFLVGQPTPVYSGLTVEWMENYFPKGIPFGSRASITLNEGATAELLQAKPNSMAFEAMSHKEDLMFSVGAKIINRDQKVEKKEKEVEIEAASQKSVLKTIRDNLQTALFNAVTNAASFIGIEVVKGTHKIELNENFDLTSMDPDEIRSTSELYNSNQISFGEMRENLRRSGIAKLTDDEAKAAIMADKAMKEALAPPPSDPTVGNDGKSNPKPSEQDTK
jgi:Domain of unknown function (DUF4055)